MGQERQREPMVPPQERYMIQVGRPYVDVPKFRKREIRLVQGGVDRRSREHAVHRQHHPLRSASLGQVVVNDRYCARLIDGTVADLGRYNVLCHLSSSSM